MTTSFGWKRKGSLKTSSATAFSGGEREEEDDDSLEKECVDWLTATKRRRLNLLEDNIAKSKRHVSCMGWWVVHYNSCLCALQASN